VELRISEMQYLEIDDFLYKLCACELLVKYDGIRIERKFSVILRKDMEFLRAETDFPYGEISNYLAINKIEKPDCLDTVIKILIEKGKKKYGEDIVMLLSFKNDNIWVQIVSDRTTMITAEGRAKEIDFILSDKSKTAID